MKVTYTEALNLLKDFTYCTCLMATDDRMTLWEVVIGQADGKTRAVEIDSASEEAHYGESRDSVPLVDFPSIGVAIDHYRRHYQIQASYTFA